MFLSLPGFDKGIPTKRTFGGASKVHLSLARSLSLRNSIRDQDLARMPAGRPISTQKFWNLIGKGWERETGHLFDFKHLGLAAVLNITSEESRAMSEAAYNGDLPDCQVKLQMTDSYETVTLAPILTDLEALHPGLGAKAMIVIEDSLTTLGYGPSYTPLGAYYMAQHIYWGGETDETTYAEAFADDEEVQCVPTMKELFGWMPSWVIVPHQSARRVSLAKQAQRFASTSYGPLLKQLCAIEKAGKRLCNQHKKNTLFSLPEMECGIPLVTMYWHESDEDALLRIFDDYYQYCAEVGMPSTLISIPVEMTADGKDIARLLQKLTLIHTFLSEVDKTIGLLLEINKRQIKEGKPS